MNTPSQNNKKTLPGIFTAPATGNELQSGLRNIRSDQRKANHEKGSVSEKKAARYLEDKGYEILTQNFRFHKNEIDIIAKDGKYLVFVEVKARKNPLHGYGFQAVDLHKQSLIRKVAQAYLINNRLSLTDTPCRFDVVSLDGDEITLFKNAF